MSFFLVQWMPGPCTEGGGSKEFSLISLDDVKEDYRYALEIGRITLATYRFSSGPNVASMHRLCKILGASGEKTALEQELMSAVQNGSNNQQGVRNGNGGGERVVYEIDDDQKPVAVISSQPAAINPPRHVPWEMEREMMTLLKENHQLRKEAETLKGRLDKSVDVTDLKNILETTIMNIQQKQMTNPMPLNGSQVPRAGHQPAIDTLALASITVPQVSAPPIVSPTSMQSASISPGIKRPVMSRQTPPLSTHAQPKQQQQQKQQRRQQQRPKLPSMREPRMQPITAMSIPSSLPPHVTPVESDNPYIVRVQSLAEPTPHPVGQIIPAADPHQASHHHPSRMGGQTSTSQASQQPSANHNILIRKNKTGSRQRQIKPPQWQSNYVADGIVERLRITRVEQNGASTSSNDVIEVPSSSTQQTQQAITAPQIEVRVDQDLYDSDKQLVELVPGMGVKLSRRQLRMSQKTRGFSQYTRNLMVLIFTMKELTICSVTGYKATGRGSENAIARPALDQTKVHAIIAAVQRRFPAVSHFKVKQIMSQKLMDIRKTLRNKQFRNTKWKRGVINNLRR